VTTAPPVGESAQTLIDPMAALTVRQKVVPLNRKITRYAQTKPEGLDLFQVTHVKIGGIEVPFEPVKDWFAPAQFEEMSDADRLSRDGYELMVAGVTAGGDAISAGAELTRLLEYETKFYPEPQSVPDFYRPTVEAQIAGTALGATATAPLRVRGAGAYAPPPGTPPLMKLHEEEYVIASTTDLSARLDITGLGTRGEVELALKAYLKANPAAKHELQVVPRFEAEGLGA